MNPLIEELRSLGRESYKKTMLRHGCPEPIFGVSIEEMKKIVKRVKKDHALALDLYDSGIYDAMYLAGLIADDAKMTVKDLQRWADRSTCHAISEYTVAWVAAESPHGLEMALKWIDSKKETIAAGGWATLSSLVSITEDGALDIPLLKRLLGRVRETIHSSPNRVRYTMNGFVIAAGSYVKELTPLCLETAKKIGPVTVDMGDTECKVRDAASYIDKVKKRGSLGKKRKTAKC